MSYIECFVAAVPEGNREKYITFAAATAKIFRANGATRVVENWESDVAEGTLTSFPMAVKREPGEKVVMGWVEWPSRAARDTGMEAAMTEMQKEMSYQAMPFDGKRLIFGGFDTILEA